MPLDCLIGRLKMAGTRLAHVGRTTVGGPLHLLTVQRHRWRRSQAAVYATGRIYPYPPPIQHTGEPLRGRASRRSRDGRGSRTSWMRRAARLRLAQSTPARSPRCRRLCLSITCTEMGRQAWPMMQWTCTAARAFVWGRTIISAAATKSVPDRDHGPEGANILTRNLMIFGQGAIRCHPYVLREMTAARETDHPRGTNEFDPALFAHMGFTLTNAVRSSSWQPHLRASRRRRSRARRAATTNISSASAPRSPSRPTGDAHPGRLSQKKESISSTPQATYFQTCTWPRWSSSTTPTEGVPAGPYRWLIGPAASCCTRRRSSCTACCAISPTVRWRR